MYIVKYLCKADGIKEEAFTTIDQAITFARILVDKVATLEDCRIYDGIRYKDMYGNLLLVTFNPNTPLPKDKPPKNNPFSKNPS